MNACPRCEQPLASRQLDKEAEFSVCDGCRGILLTQPNLVRMLRSLTEATAGSFDANTPVLPVPDKPGDVDCPGCSKTMETFGYMEARIVMLDRCSPCRLIWIDGDEELETLVRMFARTRARAGEVQAVVDELDRHLSALVYATSNIYDGMGIGLL